MPLRDVKSCSFKCELDLRDDPLTKEENTLLGDKTQYKI